MIGWYHRWSFALMVTLILVALCQLREIEQLTPVGLIGVFAVIGAALVIMCKSLFHPAEQSSEQPTRCVLSEVTDGLTD